MQQLGELKDKLTATDTLGYDSQGEMNKSISGP